jgi:hypothetical protein
LVEFPLLLLGEGGGIGGLLGGHCSMYVCERG